MGIPTAGSPAAPFLQSLAALRLPAAVTTMERRTVSGNFVPAQREVILRSALAIGADFIAMIDDDMVLPTDALVRLYDVIAGDDRIGLVGALYYSRDGLRPMAVSGWDAARTTSAYTPGFDGRTAVNVDGVGFGCVLIRGSVLHELKRPFFGAQIFIEERAGRVRICNEDYLFCAALRAVNRRVMLHSGVRCGHYDRASGRTFPERPETAAQTESPRMTVSLPDGKPALIPLAHDVPEAREAHESTTIEYVYSGDEPV
jgi:hypothetical protein